MNACIETFFNCFKVFLQWLNSMYIVENVSYGSFLIVIGVFSLVIGNMLLIAKRD